MEPFELVSTQIGGLTGQAPFLALAGFACSLACQSCIHYKATLPHPPQVSWELELLLN